MLSLTGKVFKSNHLNVLILILAIKAFLWSFCFSVAHIFPLSPVRYFVGFHHFQPEARITEGQVDFFSLGVYSDAEWYLSIAATGYPDAEEIARAATRKEKGEGAPYVFAEGHPLERFYKYTEWDVDLKFAFFPLSPLFISFFHHFMPLNAAAFWVTNLLSTGAFFAFYLLVVLYLKDEKLALKSLLLLIFYPFSVFYQAYYPEGLFLLLSVLSFYFLKRERYLPAVICLFLLSMTKAIGVFLVLPLMVLSLKTAPVGHDKGNLYPLNLLAVGCGALGLLPYAFLNYIKTGRWDYFSFILQRWGYESTSFLKNLVDNVVMTGIGFFHLPFFSFHESQLDYVVMLLFALFLLASYTRLPREWWVFSFLLWFLPLITKDLMSFSRYMSVSFPAFVFLASLLRKDGLFYLFLAIFIALSLLVHALLVQWYWVG